MENYLTQITNYLWTQSWQIAILAVTIAAVSLLLKNKSAHIRYLLWLIFLAKCFVPPLLTIPLAILPQEQIAQPIIETATKIPAVLVETAETTVYEPASLPSAPVESIIFDKFAAITKSQWLGAAWILGVVIFVLVAGIKAIRLNLWLKREREPLAVDLQKGIKDWFAELKEKKFPRVWLVDGIAQPFVWGLLRGGIYLPSDFAEIKAKEHRRGILSHELSHVLRFDAAVNLLQIIAQAVFWFHPFVWWANKKIRAEREKCCDEMAIAWLGTKARDFSTAIVNILAAEHKSTQSIPSLAIAGPVKNIEDRIKTIMNPGKKFYKHPSILAAITILLLALITVPTTLALTSRPAKKTNIQVEGSYRIRHFVRAVYDADKNKVTVQGQEQEMHEDNWPSILGKVPDRSNTVLEVALAPGTAPEIYSGIDPRIEDLGFEYVSFIGEHPIGSKGSPSHVYFTSQYKSSKEIAAKLQSVDELLYCKSIKFKHSWRGEINAFLQLGITSHPKTKWEIRVRLLDAESKEIKAVYKQFENSGFIRGIAMRSKQDLTLEFGKVEDVDKVKSFEVRMREIRDENLAMEIDEHSEEILEAADDFFDRIRKADYEHILKYYENGRWKHDGWKKLMPDHLYMTRTGFPSWVRWICENFKDNPITSVEFGAIFVSVEEIYGLDRKNWPTVPYKLVLKDGGTIEGNLLFRYKPERKRSMFRTTKAYWQGMLGLDWHLQDEPIKRPETQSTDSSSAPQILTSGYILSVPADMPELKGILPVEGDSGTPMITPEKLGEFLTVVRTTPMPGAMMLSAPKLLTNDGETGTISTANVKDFGYIKLKLKNTVGADRKTVKLELDFEYSVGQDITSVSTTATVLSEHAIAVAGSIPLDGQMVLLLVKPQILERQFPKTGVVDTNNDKKTEADLKVEVTDQPKIQIESRFFLVSTNASGINDFFEREKIAFPSDKHDPNYTSELDDEQLDQLLKLVRNVKVSQSLATPKVIVFDDEEATLNIYKEVFYTSGYNEPNEPLDQPQPKQDSAKTGVLLTVKPILRNENIDLDINYEVSNITGYEKHMYKEKYPYKIPVIQKVVTDTRALFPLGQTILLGGQKLTQREKKNGQIVDVNLLVLIKAEKVDVSEDKER